MKRSLMLTVAAAMLLGCSATLTPRQQSELDEGRRQIKELLDGFATAVRLDEPQRIRPLLPPRWKTRKARRKERQVELAGWLDKHSGYSLVTEPLVAGIDWGDLQGQELHLEVPGTNAYGAELEGEFRLTKTPEGWRIADFAVELPEKLDRIDPSPAAREAVLSVVRKVVEKLKRGQAASIHYEVLPQEPIAQWRVPKLGWWERLTSSDVPENWRIMNDLLIAEKLRVGFWAEPEEELQYLYLPPDGILAVYEVDYIWPGGGVDEPEVLEIKFYFLPQRGAWRFSHLRLVGRAIPWSE